MNRAYSIFHVVCKKSFDTNKRYHWYHCDVETFTQNTMS